MPKPPKAKPNSDIEGVHQDERLNVETALEAGQDAGDLERARKESTARPPYSDNKKILDRRGS